MLFVDHAARQGQLRRVGIPPDNTQSQGCAKITQGTGKPCERYVAC